MCSQEGESIGRRLFMAVKNLQRCGAGLRTPDGIRQSECAMLYSVLFCIARKDPAGNDFCEKVVRSPSAASDCPGITVGELSVFTHQTPSGVSQTVRALEEKGLVARYTLPVDRRNVYVRPTERGRVLVQEMEDTFFTRLDRVAEEMGRKDTDRLIALIEKLTGILSRHREENAALCGGKEERSVGGHPAFPVVHSVTERMNECP